LPLSHSKDTSRSTWSENSLPQHYTHTGSPHSNPPHLNLLPSPRRSFSCFLGNPGCFRRSSRAVPSRPSLPAGGMLGAVPGGFWRRCLCQMLCRWEESRAGWSPSGSSAGKPPSATARQRRRREGHARNRREGNAQLQQGCWRTTGSAP